MHNSSVHLLHVVEFKTLKWKELYDFFKNISVSLNLQMLYIYIWYHTNNVLNIEKIANWASSVSGFKRSMINSQQLVQNIGPIYSMQQPAS